MTLVVSPIVEDETVQFSSPTGSRFMWLRFPEVEDWRKGPGEDAFATSLFRDVAEILEPRFGLVDH